jgi:hypothetical protein
MRTTSGFTLCKPLVAQVMRERHSRNIRSHSWEAWPVWNLARAMGVIVVEPSTADMRGDLGCAVGVAGLQWRWPP